MSDKAAQWLRDNQQQLDADGSMVGVSRQALDEVLERTAELEEKLLRAPLGWDDRIRELEAVAEAAAMEESTMGEANQFMTQQARIDKLKALRAAGYLKEQQK